MCVPLCLSQPDLGPVIVALARRPRLTMPGPGVSPLGGTYPDEPVPLWSYMCILLVLGLPPGLSAGPAILIAILTRAAAGMGLVFQLPGDHHLYLLMGVDSHLTLQSAILGRSREQHTRLAPHAAELDQAHPVETRIVASLRLLLAGESSFGASALEAILAQPLMPLLRRRILIRRLNVEILAYERVALVHAHSLSWT